MRLPVLPFTSSCEWMTITTTCQQLHWCMSRALTRRPRRVIRGRAGPLPVPVGPRSRLTQGDGSSARGCRLSVVEPVSRRRESETTGPPGGRRVIRPPDRRSTRGHASGTVDSASHRAAFDFVPRESRARSAPIPGARSAFRVRVVRGALTALGALLPSSACLCC